MRIYAWKAEDLFDKDIFKETKKLMLDDCKQYLNNTVNLTHFYDDLIMTNSWGNLTDPKHSHHDHVHPFSIVSGVLYLDNNSPTVIFFFS